MKKRVIPDLTGVEETLLIPLWARARETRRPYGLVRDSHALEIASGIDYDFRKLSIGWSTQTTVAVRTALIDKATKTFLTKHPGTLVINLAAGLDTRVHRVEDGLLTWVDVDLPNSLALRRNFFEDDTRHQFIEGSVLEDHWCHSIARQPNQPVLIIIEGLVMYFTPEETRELMIRLANFFPGAEILMECVSPFAVTSSEAYFQRRGQEPLWKGGLASGHEIENWDSRLYFIGEWRIMEHYPLRWGIASLARYIPQIADYFKIIHLGVAPNG